jgi:hypothetical protein
MLINVQPVLESAVGTRQSHVVRGAAAGVRADELLLFILCFVIYSKEKWDSVLKRMCDGPDHLVIASNL